MKHKVLLADDSLTIQKVIKITLAAHPYELIDCQNENELFTNLKTHKPAIVLLDFNLSETKSGYDLARQIKEKSPSTKVLMLYGTFDSIDEAELKAAGGDEKIIKPFDSAKFVSICASLAAGASESKPVPTKTVVEPTPAPVEMKVESSQDDWVVDSPEIEDKTEDIGTPFNFQEIPRPGKNQLVADVEDWGIEIPAKLDDADSQIDPIELPPVMESSLDSSPTAKNNANKIPSQEDLEYPDMFSPEGHSSKLISISELKQDDIESTIEDDKTREIDLDFEPIEDVRSIEDQIKDEINTNDLWQADDFSVETTQMDIPKNVAPEKKTKKESKKESASADIDLNNLKDKLQPIIEQIVREYCESSIEKIAWEVIPDLAENLIKKELSRIADSVISDDR
ncbi:MAG: response regulator [Bacteriovoracaceae bacterium]|nr:response regulator [Bacteriovoracaceae bacterium]